MMKMRKKNTPKDSNEDSNDMNLDDEMEEGGEESGENKSSEDDETTAKDRGKKDFLASDSDSEMIENDLKSRA